ncbi:uncharacterized protein LOC136036987 [Artemia franciscana]|uniref:CUB domain-containing protein n=1 Tax=Artemia franciscana TaxID=6661 RepID=A0AA88HXW8_ARTSF|nr:hypothetical protein QYM36_004850 [Artemia franciscana]
MSIRMMLHILNLVILIFIATHGHCGILLADNDSEQIGMITNSAINARLAYNRTEKGGVSGNFNFTNSTVHNQDARKKKFLSIFSVVRFVNEMCTANNFYNGTCLTAAECATAGGTASGYCASGFGVCCVIATQTCGSSTNKNCTYFQNPGYPANVSGSRQCSLTVNKCSSDICQVRLDFLAFGIAQPEVQSSTNTILATQCTTDTFTVSGASNNVPAICGLNTNQHMYLDMTTGQNSFTLSFTLGANDGPAGQPLVTSGQRYWNIKISQIPCNSMLTAPSGCLQYYTSASGTIRSFNYDTVTPSNSRHLANQDYAICFRMEQGYCGICYSVCDTDPAFSISLGYNPNSGLYTTTTNGAIPYVCTTDYVQIPGAFTPATGTTGNTAAQYADRICGTAFSVSNTNGASSTPQTVCTTSKPFELRFKTDSGEVIASGTIPQETGIHGFCLNYFQQSCSTSG